MKTGSKGAARPNADRATDYPAQAITANVATSAQETIKAEEIHPPDAMRSGQSS